MAADGISFWDVFFVLLIWIPLIMIWVFVLMDLFAREDMNGWVKALWVFVIIVLPFFGALFYLIFRPITAADVEMQEAYTAERDYDKAANAADKLHKLSELRDKGDISQDEFDKQKAKLLKE
ncbi:MAG: SHOCT domain-containing protein [Actinobacteria bacterium]|nr:SHOCT domain-containing protein [Actinomycetota bacterium]